MKVDLSAASALRITCDVTTRVWPQRSELLSLFNASDGLML